MSRSIAEVQRDLRAVLKDPAPLEVDPLAPLADRPPRRSSVLILFGALDQTPAYHVETGAEADPVGTGPGASAPPDPAARFDPAAHFGPAARLDPAARFDPAARLDPPVPLELDVLLTRRADGMRHHPGQIAFPGGGAEPADADATQTALREAQEETGLDPTGVEVLGMLPEVLIPVSNNLVTPVVGWWRLPSEVAADHSESVDVFRAPVAELLDPTNRGTSVLSRSAHTHRGPAFRLHDRLGGRIVWGFTGILLATLFDRLGWAMPWNAEREFEVRP